MHLMGRQLIAAQNITHLRAIAMRNNYTPAIFNHIGQMTARLSHGIPLVGNVGIIFIGDQRVAADGDQCCTGQSGTSKNACGKGKV